MHPVFPSHVQSTRLSEKRRDNELEYLQTLTNRRNSTNEDNVGEQPVKRGRTTKDMASSYG